MQCARQVDVGDELPLASHETPIFPDAAIGADEAIDALAAHGRGSTGRLAPRMRSAASAIASMICA